MANKTKIFFSLSLILSLSILVLTPLIGLAAGSSTVDSYTWEVGIPGLANPGSTSTFDEAGGITNFIKDIIKWAFRLAGILAFAMIIYAGFEYAIFSGAADKQKDALNKITDAIVGLLLLFSFWIILNTINPDILQTKEHPLPVANPTTTPTINQNINQVTLQNFITAAKSYANPDPTTVIKVFSDSDHKKYCRITTKTVGHTSTQSIDFGTCLNQYPNLNNYWNALPSKYKTGTYFYGMSCDLYVATVMRNTIDPNYQPFTNAELQYNYVTKSPKYQCIIAKDGKYLTRDQATNGSILFYDTNGNFSTDHTALWLDNQRWQASKDTYLPMNRGYNFDGSWGKVIAICRYKGF